MTDLTSKFFFSYSTKDSAKVKRVKVELESRGHSVWIDETGIRAGDPITSRIDNGLETSEHFVLFTSSSWMRSNWTRAEFDAAFYLTRYSNDRKLFVVRLDSTPLEPFLASRRAIVFASGAQVANELIIAVQPSNGDVRSEDWSILEWNALEDRYLTSLAVQVLGDTQSNSVSVFLGDRVLRMDLIPAVRSDQIIISDLKSELRIYQVLVDVISSYRLEIIEDALGKFKPGYEAALKRKSVELDQCRARLRETLHALSPRLWVREQPTDQQL
jgi:TIR domain